MTSVEQLFPFDPEDPQFLNQGIWECSNVLSTVRHVTVVVRVSTDRLQQNSSIPNQLETARDFAHAHGYQVVRIVVVRESGLRVHRNPVFKGFLNLAYQGSLDIVFVTELSRLTRRTKDLIQYAQDFFKMGVRLVSIGDEFDTDDDNWYGKLLDLATLYEKESKKISDRQKRARRAKLSRGEYMGNQAPYGLEKDGKGLRIATDGSQDVVREIFQLVICGFSPSQIAKMLTERGVPTPSQRLGRRNAGQRWHDTEIRKILTNPVYCGHVQGPQSHVILLGETKRKVIPPSERTLLEYRVEPLIDQATFDTVQQILLGRVRGKDGRAIDPSVKNDPIIDVLYCADCGRQMYRVRRPWGKDHYACSTHLKQNGSCTGRHSVYCSSVRQAVIEDIYSMLRVLDIEGIVSELVRKSEMERARLTREVRQLQGQITQIENTILDVELAKVQHRITDVVAAQLVARKEAEKQDKVERMRSCEQKIFTLSAEVTPESVIDALHRLDPDTLVRTLVARIEIGVDGNIQRIVYRFVPQTSENKLAA
jgi:site-specific DNA recombinase